MSREDEKLLEDAGWEVECESPMEFRHFDGSFAKGQAALCVLSDLKHEYDTVSPKFEYKWEQLKGNILEQLNAFGEEGWELVSSFQEVHWTNTYFKRIKQ